MLSHRRERQAPHHDTEPLEHADEHRLVLERQADAEQDHRARERARRGHLACDVRHACTALEGRAEAPRNAGSGSMRQNLPTVG